MGRPSVVLIMHTPGRAVRRAGGVVVTIRIRRVSQLTINAMRVY
jgi:hypothetical protein